MTQRVKIRARCVLCPQIVEVYYPDELEFLVQVCTEEMNRRGDKGLSVMCPECTRKREAA
jgi:hypothetical protein